VRLVPNTGHFSAEELADYREGTVSTRKAARIGTHLSGCARCADLDLGLASVSSLLASLPVPAMPDLLAERLDIALAAEVRAGAPPYASTTAALADSHGMRDGGTPARAGAADHGDHIPGRPDLPARSGRDRPRLRMPGWSSPLVLRGLALAGAAAVVVGAGYLLASGQDTSGNRTGSTNTAASGAPVSRRPSAVNGSMSPAAAPGQRELRYRQNGLYATATLLTSNADYTPANLADQIRQEVTSSARFPGSASEPTNQSQSAAPAPAGAVNVPQLEGCVSKVAAGQRVRLVDIARYLGRPAAVIVLEPDAAARTLNVVVVGLACSASNSDILAQVSVPTR